MQRIFFSFVMLVLSVQVSAQNFYGKAIYHSAMNLDIELDSNSQAQMDQDQMQKMLRDALQNDHELLFDRNTSLYKEVEKLETDAKRGMRIFASVTGNGGVLFKDTKSLESVRQSEFFGKLFLITDTLEKLDWKLENETKTIGAYTCYKATAKRKTLERSFTSFGGEDKMEEDTVEITITAWYTPQIPISTGPDQYFGLPGLILEINDGSMQMMCTKLILNPKEEIQIKKPSEGQKVNDKEYQKIVEEKLQQMQQMMGNQRERRGEGGERREVRIKMR